MNLCRKIWFFFCEKRTKFWYEENVLDESFDSSNMKLSWMIFKCLAVIQNSSKWWWRSFGWVRKLSHVNLYWGHTILSLSLSLSPTFSFSQEKMVVPLRPLPQYLPQTDFYPSYVSQKKTFRSNCVYVSNSHWRPHT